MSEPRIVTPQEAQDMLGWPLGVGEIASQRLAHTVAAEPKRIAAAERAAVVRTVRNLALKYHDAELDVEADTIENGADL